MPDEKKAERAEPMQRASRTERMRDERMELADIAREARDLKLDEVPPDEQPVYITAHGMEVGPNGRPLDKDGREEPPRPGVDLS